MKEKLELAIKASILAGKEILKVYETEFDVEQKDDNSPLTLADRKAHECIVGIIASTDLPILSEEGKHMDYNIRKTWEMYWLVDPLDGTKEFIKRNGEFTVNIALMQGNYPVAGVIYVPVKKILYFGLKGVGSYKIAFENGEDGLNIDSLMSDENEIPGNHNNEIYTIVGSKSHPSQETNDYIEKVKSEKGDVEMISMGSSLKLCLVAEGLAQEYPRFAPTMEWDTAAGQAIIESSGGSVINWESKERMSYNKENLLNSWFLAYR